jgi:hypothetical protein
VSTPCQLANFFLDTDRERNTTSWPIRCADRVEANHQVVIRAVRQRHRGTEDAASSEMLVFPRWARTFHADSLRLPRGLVVHERAVFERAVTGLGRP